MGLFLFGEAGAYYRKDFFIRGGGDIFGRAYFRGLMIGGNSSI